MGTWNSISGLFQSGSVCRRVKKPLLLQLLQRKSRDLNLSPFREIEPDQMKSLFAIERKKYVSELGFEPVSERICGALRAS